MSTLLGKLIWEALIRFEGKQATTRSEAKDHLAEYCQLATSTVNNWRSGRRKPDKESFERVVRWGMEEAGMDFEWFDQICHTSEYYDRDNLEKTLTRARPSSEPENLVAIHGNWPRFHSQFIGREEEINEIMQALNSRGVITTLVGMPGSGKSRLANQVAGLCRENSQDNPFQIIYWIPMDELFDPNLSLDDFLTVVLRISSGTYGSASPFSARKFLTETSILIILDNFEIVNSPEPILDFFKRLPRKSSSSVIITSRSSDIPTEWPIPVGGLTRDEALKKIRNEAHGQGLENIAQAPDAELLPLYTMTEGNPKALELAVGHMRVRSKSLQEVVDDLAVATEDTEEILAYFFKDAWNDFTEEEKRLFITIGLFADTFSKEAWRSIADVSGRALSEAIQKIHSLNFVSTEGAIQPEDLRYTTHPLVKAQASNHLQEQKWKALYRRWVQYFLDFAKNELVRNSSEAVYWNSLLHAETKMEKLDRELTNMLRVIEWTAKHDNSALVEFMMVIVHYLGRKRLNARLHYCELAVEGALKLEKYAEASILKIDGLGWPYVEMKRFELARQHLEGGKEIVKRIKDKGQRSQLVALANTFLSASYVAEQDFAQAQQHLPETDKIADYPHVIQERIYLFTGDFHRYQSDLLVEGSPRWRQQLELARANYESGLKSNLAYEAEFQKDINDRLGRIELQLGRPNKARERFQGVLKTAPSAFDKIRAYCGIAKSYLAEKPSDFSKARRSVNRAKEVKKDFMQSERLQISAELDKEIAALEKACLDQHHT